MTRSRLSFLSTPRNNRHRWPQGEHMLGIAAYPPTRELVGFRSRRGYPVHLLAALLLSLASAARSQETTPPPQSVPPLEQRVDAFLAQVEARRKELGVVGAAVVVVHRDRIVRIAGLGQRSAESKEPVTEDTVFPLASVTKQFTAVAVALAVSEGKMAFEDHPRRFVPDFRLKD